MLRFLVGRLLLVPLILLAVNFAVFAYARPSQAAVAADWNSSFNAVISGPRELPPPTPLLESYASYLRGALRLDLGTLDRGRGPVLDQIVDAAGKSLGLLAVAYGLSIVIGVAVGLRAVNTRPPGAAGWLLPFTSIGLSLPSFFVGSVAMGAMLLMLRHGLDGAPFPFGGFGWDRHLVLPAFALMLRPTAQIAQLASRLLGDQLNRQYVVAVRAVGMGWARIRWHAALRPILAPLLVGIGSAFRLTLGELLIVESLFAWPGLGRLIADELLSTLTPTLLASYLTVFVLLYLLVDLVVSVLARASDPRLRQTVGEVGRG